MNVSQKHAEEFLEELERQDENVEIFRFEILERNLVTLSGLFAILN